MNEKTLQVLEFDAIRKKIADCSLSEEAKRRILSENPLMDRSEVARLKSIAAEIADCMKKNMEKQESLPEIGFLIPKLAVEGAALELDELFALGLFVERSQTTRQWLLNEEKEEKEKNESPLKTFLERIPDCADIAREAFRVVDKDGALKDLPELRDMKRRIRSLTGELENAASRYANNEDLRKMLQSPLPSQRDGRTVIAVKANFRGRVRGIVHTVSATGETLFIEPEEVVEKNNELLIEKRRLDAEIARILREVTARIAEKRDILAEFHEKTIELAVFQAKARYSKDGVFALEGGFSLKKARHPLLGKNAVPIDFTISAGKRAVIITGPNTGGKTVSLKTAGLFALMNQSGLALPASEGASLPIFDGIFADIGDEQSISQSLSTFSAHIANIAAIADAATASSLVLLDELGSGTDPAEGSAIAMGVLDYLIAKKAMLIITTHHGVLKNYGYTSEGAENASVEFDPFTLSPTYHIVMGVPGESRALDIAERNGLQSAITEKARAYISGERADISALIAGLKQKHRELDRLVEENKANSARLLEERRNSDLKELKLRQKELELKRDDIGKFKKLLAESRKTLENLVRELKEGDITREKTLKVKEFLADLEKSSEIAENEVEKMEEETVSNNKKSRPQSDQPLEAGMEITAFSCNQRGVLIRKEKKGKWLVAVGSLHIAFPEDDLAPVENQQKTLKPAAPIAELAQSPKAVLELNLLGMRLEEALDALRRQIDAAVLANLPAFAVIHGKGGGVLQKGVQDFLKTEPHVADFHFSHPELGGFGRTEVELKP
jgi:DNA mismatch repair protein MutS2